MKFIILIITIIFLVSCDMGGSTTSNSTDPLDDGTNPVPTVTPTTPPVDTSCYATGTGTSITDYHRFDFVGKGWSNPYTVGWRASDYPANHGYTTSETAYYLDQFRTDGRYNIRVLAQSSPGQTADEYGNICNNTARPYTKLRMKVRLRAIGSGFTQDFTFESNVGSCSNVHEFSVPATSNPIDIEILSVDWDYDCIMYNPPYRQCTEPYCSAYCPWHHVNISSCYAVQVQLSTSYTKDIPH